MYDTSGKSMKSYLILIIDFEFGRRDGIKVRKDFIFEVMPKQITFM